MRSHVPRSARRRASLLLLALVVTGTLVVADGYSERADAADECSAG